MNEFADHGLLVAIAEFLIETQARDYFQRHKFEVMVRRACHADRNNEIFQNAKKRLEELYEGS
jgi:hypothetical protein